MKLDDHFYLLISLNLICIFGFAANGETWLIVCMGYRTKNKKCLRQCEILLISGIELNLGCNNE